MFRWLLVSVAVGLASVTYAQSSAIDEQITNSLQRATQFMTGAIADHGGYAWVSSVDGQYSNGEGVCGPDRIWVQPPGTPAVGTAFLKAYAATDNEVHLGAAREVGDALIAGQLRSGGWNYSIDFDPQIRAQIPYRVEPLGRRDKIASTPKPGGWEIWRQRKYKNNKTIIDDDTTPAAIRFLVKLDQALGFQDEGVHDAAAYALRSTLGAQYPVGAWGHNYDRFGMETPSKSHYPILKASYPESWTRVTDNQFHGCYMINDRATMNMIETMLLAAEVYDDERYLNSAIRGGEFLVRAQMPDPQPAWAQQYDRHMQPVWDRKFEPPAITGGESQDVLKTLLKLYRETNDKRFLAPIPRALTYLRSCLRDDGRLARYYELKTNRPIYFTLDYQITYDDAEMPDHYGFVVDSHLDAIEQEYDRLVSGKPVKPVSQDELLIQVREVLQKQHDLGGWLEPGFVRDMKARKVVPPEGVVQSQTFIDNVTLLCDYLERGQ